MMDIFNVPGTNIINWVFYTNGSTTWQTWQKPKNCKFVNIFTLGGGGGGGGGSAGTGNRSGGGGGGSSAIARGFYQASLLPDILYIQVGAGGAGGNSGANGTGGGLSYVSFLPNTTSGNVLLRNGFNGGNGGLAIGTAGGGGTLSIQTNSILSYLGYFQAVIGSSGGAGLIANNGSSVTINNIVSGGGAGGGASALSFSGGSIDSPEVGFVPKIYGAVTTSEVGSSGFNSITSFNSSMQQPLFFTGGGGGSGSALGAGSNGGDGAFGCGGGGGGAGSAGNAGRGGNGGDGLVIITAW